MSTDVIAVPAATTVVVVDDHKTFSDLLAMALEREPDLSCVGTAAGVSQALDMIERLRPDLVVMDVQLGDGDGIVATAELTGRYPELRVVVLTAHIDTALMQRAAAAGACSLLPKDGFLSDMLAALRTSRRGGFAVHPALLRTLITARPTTCAAPPLLTRREYDVLELMAHGQDARAIAKNLKISTSTCRGYVKNVLMKLGAHSQLEAVVIATKHGLVSIGTHH
jgi:DNA-binding NarL/FixJ family response regulator